MTTTDTFWFAYADMLYKGFYLTQYRQMINARDSYISWIVAITSSASVAAWALWDKHPWLWAGIVAIAQIIGLIRPSFHYAEKFYALSLMGTELQSVIDDMEVYWLSIDDSTDETKVLKKLRDSKDKYNMLNSKYLSSWDLSPNQRCQEKAMDYRDNYISSHYFNVSIEEATV